MSEVDANYELKVLKMMLNTFLDETVSVTEEGLEFLEAKCDQVVWKLATKIYTHSGYKVEFCTARDVVNSRIGVMKSQLAQARQAAAVADQIAREKARQAAVVAHQAAAVADQIAREKVRQAAVVACRVAEEKARQAAEEEARFRQQMTRILGELAGDEGFVRVFVKVRKIVTEQLSVDEN